MSGIYPYSRGKNDEKYFFDFQILVMKFRFISVLFLTATLFSCGTTKLSEEYSSYLFSYFTGNSEGQEAIRYAISPDAYNYYALNNNEPVISSDKINNTGGVRDPHLLRGNDGKTFY